MKAVILAGGAGTRLRPLTSGRPKPMVRILDRSVLERSVELLRRCGVTDLCMTLGYLPEQIRGFFGDGSGWGVRIECRTEPRPLGTAGAVKACADFIGGEDFLVLSGDAVCTFDLARCAEAHRASGAEASLVVCASGRPTEYGLVLTDKKGRVTRFAEKPAWEGVSTDQVNTGIYFCTPRVLERIPADTVYDFARDLFPAMLAAGARLRALPAEGYWCDIGCPEEYLRCNLDALAGVPGLEPPAEPVRPGVWAASDLRGAEVTPPVYVGRNVRIAAGAKLGPGAVIGSGSRIGRGARVCRSVVDGAALADGAEAEGAVLCPGASVGENARIEPGCVLGDGASAGAGSLVTGGARLWPGVRAEAGETVAADRRDGAGRESAEFREPGVLQFEAGGTPELLARLGAAAGPEWAVIASAGGEAAAIARDAFACGLRAAGGTALRTDAGCVSAARYAACAAGAPLSVFFRQEGETLRASFFGRDGEPLPRRQERALELALGASGPAAAGGEPGTERYLAGTELLCAAAAAACRLGTDRACAAAAGAENRLLRRALEMSGGWSDQADVTFSVPSGGGGAAAFRRDGSSLDAPRLLACAALAELDRGERRLAAPDSAPAVLERLAEARGASVARPEDGDFSELRRRQLWFFDGLFLAARLSGLADRLWALSEQVPPFAALRREIPLHHAGRGAAMRALAEADCGLKPGAQGGLTAAEADGRVRVRPSRAREALVLYAESADMETAAELCGRFETALRRIDDGKKGANRASN